MECNFLLHIVKTNPERSKDILAPQQIKADSQFFRKSNGCPNKLRSNFNKTRMHIDWNWVSISRNSINSSASLKVKPQQLSNLWRKNALGSSGIDINPDFVPPILSLNLQRNDGCRFTVVNCISKRYRRIRRTQVRSFSRGTKRRDGIWWGYRLLAFCSTTLGDTPWAITCSLTTATYSPEYRLTNRSKCLIIQRSSRSI